MAKLKGIAKKIERWRLLAGQRRAPDIVHRTRRTKIILHPSGASRQPIFSVIYKSRPPVTVKRYQCSPHILYTPEAVEEQYALIKELIAKGAPFVEPIEWHVRKDKPGEIIWKEKYAGISVEKLQGKLKKEEMDKINRKVDEALKKLERYNKYIFSDAGEHNAVYNPKTKKVLFTDVRIGKKISFL